jgi:hypothetical protein
MAHPAEIQFFMHFSPTFAKSLSTPTWLWGLASWLRTYPWTILAISILIAHAFPVLLKQHSEWQEVYVRAAEKLLHRGDVYRLEDGYSYPPFMALLAIPFMALPPTLSRTVWFAINIVCIVCMWRLAWRLTAGGRLEDDRASGVSHDPGTGAFTRPAGQEHLVCFLGVACSVRYGLNGIAHQQTDIVIAGLLLFGCWCLTRNRSLSAGSCFGLAAAMKCTALLWCLYLLWKRQWKAAAWLVVVAVGVNLLPNLVRAPDRGGLWLGEWLTRYVHPLTAKDHYPGDWGSWIIYNQSISGAGNRWLTTQWSWRGSEFEVIRDPDAPTPTVVKVIVYGIETALFAGVVLILIRHRSPEEGQGSNQECPAAILEYSLVLLLMVLLSPMSSKPHFSALILPGFALARLVVYRADVISRCLLGLAIVLSSLSLPLWGGRLDLIALWFGSEMWTAILLLLGCVFALLACTFNPSSARLCSNFGSNLAHSRLSRLRSERVIISRRTFCNN